MMNWGQLLSAGIEKATLDPSLYVAISGPACTGKTETLLRRAARIMSEGVRPQDILVIAPNKAGALELTRRLRTLSPDEADDVRVESVGELCRDVFEEYRVEEETGIAFNILDYRQENELFDEVCRLNGKYERNIEIVKYLLREWTELGETKSDYYVTSEESGLHEALKQRLRSRKSALRHEVSNVIYRYFSAHEDALRKSQVSHVFVDDFQCLNRASQKLCELLCREGMTVVNDELSSVEVSDPYPYRDGAQEFVETTGAVEYRFRESFAAKAIVACALSFLARAESPVPVEDIPGKTEGVLATRREDEGSVEVIPLKTPSEESGFVVEHVLALAEGMNCEVLLVAPDSLRKEELLHGLQASAVGIEVRDAALCTFGEEMNSMAPSVVVATPQESVGISRRAVVVVGVANGNYPSIGALDQSDTVNHRRERRLQDDRLFLSLLTRAQDRLVLTYPRFDGLDSAVRSGLKIARVRSFDGEPIGLFSPSEYLQWICEQ
ncbi:UvrD-helicase domain-containing protein [Slackia piriformis]|nr:UvrD-helicase domain-containing protein [Slackia piriformis]